MFHGFRLIHGSIQATKEKKHQTNCIKTNHRVEMTYRHFTAVTVVTRMILFAVSKSMCTVIMSENRLESYDCIDITETIFA